MVKELHGEHAKSCTVNTQKLNVLDVAHIVLDWNGKRAANCGIELPICVLITCCDLMVASLTSN